MLMDSLKNGEEHMKMIFDLCDQDKDGLIRAQDFRRIGQEHFDKSQDIECLIQVMDPQGTGSISFDMFYQGTKSFLQENQHVQSSESAPSTPSISAQLNSTEEYDSAFSSDDVYPISRHDNACVSNGYMASTSVGQSEEVEFVLDPCEDEDSPSGLPPTQSTPGSRSPGTIRRESPTLVARQLLHRHQLTLPPDSPSQGSTPGEVEEERLRLNDQVLELSYRLEELEEDQKDNEGYKARLKRENAELKARLEEYEDMLSTSEKKNKLIISKSQENLKASVDKIRRMSENRLMDAKSQLLLATEKINKLEASEANLKTHLAFVKEENLKKEDAVEEAEERHKSTADELRKTRDLLRTERAKWTTERDSLNRTIQEREGHIQQLQLECEEIIHNHKTDSITASDLDREIKKLKKELEESKCRNEELQTRFLQQGKELVASNPAPQSLEMEIDSATKDEVLQVLQESEDMNSRLKNYIDGMLATIMETHPEILEKT